MPNSGQPLDTPASQPHDDDDRPAKTRRRFLSYREVYQFLKERGVKPTTDDDQTRPIG